METVIRYQVKFTEDTKHGKFTDALYYDKLPDEETITKDAQVRIDNWVTTIETVPKEPTEEEIAEQYKQLAVAKEAESERIASLENYLEGTLLEKWNARGVVLKDPIDIVFDNISKGLLDVKDLSEEVVEKPIDEKVVEEEIPVVKG